MICPKESCGYESSDMGIKVHHVQAHDESLAQVEYSCENCGEVDTKYQSTLSEKNYCSDACRYEDQITQESFECDNCGDEGMRPPSALAKYEHHFCSPKCSNEYLSGENHYLYDGGSDKFTLTPEGRAWRKSVFERDDYTCQDCGRSGCRLNAHHIKSRHEYPERKADVSNGTTLCLMCHAKAHRGEQAYYLIKGNIHRLDNV